MEKSNNSEEYDWDEYPSDQFSISNTHFEFNVSAPTRGRLYVRNGQCLWQSLERLLQRHSFCIFSCECTRLGVFKHCGAYYICDVQSYGLPIFDCGKGVAYLLRASCFVDFVKSILLIVGSSECSEFTIRGLEIVKIIEKDDKCKEKWMEKKETCGTDVINDAVCPLADEKKANKKKKKSPLNKGKNNTCCKKSS